MTITLLTICLIVQSALIEPPTDWQMFNRFQEVYLTDFEYWDLNSDYIVNYKDWIIYERQSGVINSTWLFLPRIIRVPYGQGVPALTPLNNR